MTKGSCLRLLKCLQLNRKWLLSSTPPQAHSGLLIIFFEKKKMFMKAAICY